MSDIKKNILSSAIKKAKNQTKKPTKEKKHL